MELDTVLCAGTKRSVRDGTWARPQSHELLLYAVHSVLHVQGYDDLRPKGAGPRCIDARMPF